MIYRRYSLEFRDQSIRRVVSAGETVTAMANGAGYRSLAVVGDRDLYSVSVIQLRLINVGRV